MLLRRLRRVTRAGIVACISTIIWIECVHSTHLVYKVIFVGLPVLHAITSIGSLANSLSECMYFYSWKCVHRRLRCINFGLNSDINSLAAPPPSSSHERNLHGKEKNQFPTKRTFLGGYCLWALGRLCVLCILDLMWSVFSCHFNGSYWCILIFISCVLINSRQSMQNHVQSHVMSL